MGYSPWGQKDDWATEYIHIIILSLDWQSVPYSHNLTWILKKFKFFHCYKKKQNICGNSLIKTLSAKCHDGRWVERKQIKRLVKVWGTAFSDSASLSFVREESKGINLSTLTETSTDYGRYFNKELSIYFAYYTVCFFIRFITEGLPLEIIPAFISNKCWKLNGNPQGEVVSSITTAYYWKSFFHVSA